PEIRQNPFVDKGLMYQQKKLKKSSISLNSVAPPESNTTRALPKTKKTSEFPDFPLPAATRKSMAITTSKKPFKPSAKEKRLPLPTCSAAVASAMPKQLVSSISLKKWGSSVRPTAPNRGQSTSATAMTIPPRWTQWK